MQKSFPAGHLVYLIADAWGHVKVGRTNNLKARLATLQTGNAGRLEVAAWLHCSGQTQSMEIETVTKSLLSHHKTGGGDEWFYVDFQDALKALGCASNGR
jgi:hypothetical protein